MHHWVTREKKLRRDTIKGPHSTMMLCAPRCFLVQTKVLNRAVINHVAWPAGLVSPHMRLSPRDQREKWKRMMSMILPSARASSHALPPFSWPKAKAPSRSYSRMVLSRFLLHRFILGHSEEHMNSAGVKITWTNREPNYRYHFLNWCFVFSRSVPKAKNRCFSKLTALI